MLSFLASVLVGQLHRQYVPKAPPGTPAQDRRYRWGNSNRATVTVDGKRIAGQAVIRDNRVQVPMRPIFQALGANVTWYPENRKVVALTRDKTISLILDQNFAYVPKQTRLDYPPRMMHGTVYVPLRFVAQALGAKVGFDRKRKVAFVEMPTGDAKVR